MGPRKSIHIFLGFVLLGLLISSCDGGDSKKWEIPFPNRDIVFEANNHKDYAIGFINADGSSPVILNTYEIRFFHPIWSQDKKNIYFQNVRSNPDNEMDGYGDMGMWQSDMGITYRCSSVEDDGAFFPTQNDQVIYSNSAQLILLDFNNCKKQKYLMDYSGKNIGVGDPFLSKDKRYMLYSETDFAIGLGKTTIVQMDLQTGKRTSLGEGMFATLSPDNRQIAFDRPDGIYLMDFDGNNIHRLIDYPLSEDHGYGEVPPIPYWSPDGKWLIYHKCVGGQSGCDQASDFGIYKWNLSTNQETKIYDGGVYPYWP
jgi:Tol biopolymer transport system component